MILVCKGTKLLMILVCKGTCNPVAPLFKGQGEQCPRNAPPFRRPWIRTLGRSCDKISPFALVSDLTLIYMLTVMINASWKILSI